MIDFWEAIGRLATYKRLNEEFLRVLPPVEAVSSEMVYSERLDATGVGANIPEENYKEVQDFFDQILTENFLSLMSAGELIWSYNYQESRDAMNTIICITSKAPSELFGPSTRYFISLGLLIVDSQFREGVKKKTADATKVIRRLSDRAIDHINYLANNEEFNEACVRFGKKPWDIACDIGLHYRNGYMHGVGISKGNWTQKSSSPVEDYAAASTR